MKTIDVLIRKVDEQEWYTFRGCCLVERISATAKLKELIARYVKEQGKEEIIT